MTEIKKPSLIELRKKANSLGIADYAKYSKDELAELIAKKESEDNSSDSEESSNATTEQEVGENCKDFNVSESESSECESKDDVEENTEREQISSEVEGSKKMKEKPKKEKKAKVKSEKPKKEKKATKTAVKFILKKDADISDLSEKNKAVVEALQQNDGRSVYKISKDCNTYHSVVTRIIEKYFDIE